MATRAGLTFEGQILASIKGHTLPLNCLAGSNRLEVVGDIILYFLVYSRCHMHQFKATIISSTHLMATGICCLCPYLAKCAVSMSP